MNQEIEVGMYARYDATGTVGKVTEIRSIDGKKFALLESTGLLYEISTLEKTVKPVEKKKAEKQTIDTFEKIKTDLMDSLAGGDMSENVGGG